MVTDNRSMPPGPSQDNQGEYGVPAPKRRKVKPVPPAVQAATEINEIQGVVGQDRETRDIPMLGRLRWGGLSYLLGGIDTLGRELNPDALGIDQLAAMRLDATLRAGLTLIKAPILARIRQATIQCDDPKQKAWLTHNLIDNGLLYRVVRQQLRALDFGVAPMEKVFEVQDQTVEYDTTDATTGTVSKGVAWKGPATVYKDVIEVNPQTIPWFRRRVVPFEGKPADGSFDGFTQNTGLGIVDIPAVKAFVYTHDKEYGNTWGMPRIRPAYSFWLWKQALLKYWMIWLEKKAIPTRVVHYPVGNDPTDGTPYRTIAVQMINALDAVAGVALPQRRGSAAEGGAGTRGVAEWLIEELQTTDKTDLFIKSFDRLGVEMLRAIFVPERVFTEGQFGTKAEAEAHADVFMITLDAEMSDIIDADEQYLMAPLTLVNFGSDAARAKIQVPGLTNAEQAFLWDAFMLLLADVNTHGIFDVRAIAEQFKIPVKDVDTVAAQQAAAGAGTGAAGMPGSSNAGGLGPGGTVATQVGAPPVAVQPPAPTPNLVLDDVVTLAAGGFDASKWTVTPDATSKLGYKVVSAISGVRIGGAFAEQVIKAYEAEQAKAAKSGGKGGGKSEAEKAQAKGDAEAKKEQHQSEAEAKKEQHASDAEAKKQQHESDAAARKEQVAARQADAAAKRDAAAQVRTAKTEKAALEQTTRKLPVSSAVQAVTAAGWTAAGAVPDPAQALASAQSLAAAHPELMVTVVKAANGSIVATKPIAQISAAPRSGNVAADDPAPLLRHVEAQLASLLRTYGLEEPVEEAVA